VAPAPKEILRGREPCRTILHNKSAYHSMRFPGVCGWFAFEYSGKLLRKKSLETKNCRTLELKGQGLPTKSCTSFYLEHLLFHVRPWSKVCVADRTCIIWTCHENKRLYNWLSCAFENSLSEVKETWMGVRQVSPVHCMVLPRFQPHSTVLLLHDDVCQNQEAMIKYN
jgi:hypothetical protein